MNYKQARIFLASLIIIVCLLIGGAIFRSCSRKTVTSTTHSAPSPSDINSIDSIVQEKRKIATPTNLRDLATEFNDVNDQHLTYAQKIGLKPISSTKDILSQTKPIVEVRSNDNLKLDDLTHSYPYLVPSAAKLLNDIGAEFSKRVADQYDADYKIVVTSLLRTKESVNRLKRGNVNSTQNSAHLYGTTFDISYVRFHRGSIFGPILSDAEMKLILAQILKEMKQDGRCLVKFERKQGCFHITSTGR